MTHIGAGVGAASSKECLAVLVLAVAVLRDVDSPLGWRLTSTARGYRRGGVRGRGRPEVHALVSVTLVK